VEVLDGASVGHLNTAQMTTPPDGTSPRMELSLYAGFGSNGGDADSADDASLVYALYAKGMADRLVTDGSGQAALAGDQGQALRNGWGDWYAMDFLISEGFDADTASVDVIPQEYLSGGGGARTQPLDCPVGLTSSPCENFNGAGNGGYTYADLGQVAGVPDPAADGEIWAQTLWELRQRLTTKYGAAAGVVRAETYVTRAMELLGPNPSMLDARTALIRAEVAATATGGPFAGSDDTDVLWTAFANRGMGYSATTTGPADTAPVAAFDKPPALAAVTGLAATGEGSTAVALHWNAVAGAHGYEVYRRTQGGGYPALPLATPAGTALTDTGLPAGATYCYQVAAAFGPRSPEACASTNQVAPSLSKVKKKVKVSRKGTFVLKVSGAPTATGTVVVRAKGLGKVKATFTSRADGTAKVKLKLKANKLAKLRRAGPTKATISVELGGATAEKKVKLVAG
jgi:hypothetical protein